MLLPTDYGSKTAVGKWKADFNSDKQHISILLMYEDFYLNLNPVTWHVNKFITPKATDNSSQQIFSFINFQHKKYLIYTTNTEYILFAYNKVTKYIYSSIQVQSWYLIKMWGAFPFHNISTSLLNVSSSSFNSTSSIWHIYRFRLLNEKVTILKRLVLL